MGDCIGVQLPLREIYLSLTNHPGQLSLAIPSWVGAMSTGQRAVMLCDWGVKADMVLFAGNTVWSISQRVRGVCVDALYKSTFTLLYFTMTVQQPRCICVGIYTARLPSNTSVYCKVCVNVAFVLRNIWLHTLHSSPRQLCRTARFAECANDNRLLCY